MISGRLFRTISEAAWNAPRRLADMERMGIARQVLSPMPELLSYWLPTGDAKVLLAHVNAAIAACVDRHPDAMIGMGAVPLQDVDEAIVALRWNKDALALNAVEVGSNINGVPIGDQKFLAFFEAAADLGVAVFVHPLRAAGKDRLVGPPVLEQIVAFPSEAALAAASLITGGTLARLPHLRLGFSHGGGGLALTLARMEHFWRTLPSFADALNEAPSTTARRAFYDLAVFDPEVVRFLSRQLGTDRLLIGSDYPFGAHLTEPLDLLAAAGFSTEEIVAVGQTNAEQFLNL